MKKTAFKLFSITKTLALFRVVLIIFFLAESALGHNIPIENPPEPPFRNFQSLSQQEVSQLDDAELDALVIADLANLYITMVENKTKMLVPLSEQTQFQKIKLKVSRTYRMIHGTLAHYLLTFITQFPEAIVFSGALVAARWVALGSLAVAGHGALALFLYPFPDQELIQAGYVWARTTGAKLKFRWKNKVSYAEIKNVKDQLFENDPSTSLSHHLIKDGNFDFIIPVQNQTFWNWIKRKNLLSKENSPVTTTELEAMILDQEFLTELKHTVFDPQLYQLILIQKILSSSNREQLLARTNPENWDLNYPELKRNLVAFEQLLNSIVAQLDSLRIAPRVYEAHRLFGWQSLPAFGQHILVRQQLRNLYSELKPIEMEILLASTGRRNLSEIQDHLLKLRKRYEVLVSRATSIRNELHENIRQEKSKTRF